MKNEEKGTERGEFKILLRRSSARCFGHFLRTLHEIENNWIRHQTYFILFTFFVAMFFFFFPHVAAMSYDNDC